MVTSRRKTTKRARPKWFATRVVEGNGDQVADCRHCGADIYLKLGEHWWAHFPSNDLRCRG